MGDGDAYIEPCSGTWEFIGREYLTVFFKHARRCGIDGGLYFFQHTPEVLLSALREPSLQAIISGSDALANRLLASTRYIKYRAYRRYWPDLEPRPKIFQSDISLAHRPAELKLMAGRRLTYVDRWKIPVLDLIALLERDLDPD